MKIEEFVRVSPPIWPGKQVKVQPGDLTILAPKGIGIEGPSPIRPWDDPFSERYKDPAEYYAYNAHVSHPFLNAPLTEGAGGTAYFDGQPDEADIRALLRLLEIRTQENQYAVFVGNADTPREERYLTQIRIVTRFALRYMFDALSADEYEHFPVQDLKIGELV